MKSSLLTISLVLTVSSLLTACATHQHHEHDPLNHAQYVPGLGEIMAQSSTRHAKLWFAGQAHNWELAAYEVDELHEGFEDAAKFHPTHKQVKQSIPELIAQYTNQPLAGLEQAIKDKNMQAFIQNYEYLTVACNACHQATDFGFNKVTAPSFNPFSNQAFGDR